MSKSEEDPHQMLWHLIKDIRFAMLTHRHANGELHAHPLRTQNRSLHAQATLYFFVSRRTGLAERLAVDGNVNVSYAEPAKDAYVSIAGTARVSEDRAQKERLFNALSKAWFPQGVDDPDLQLVEVRVAHAEYWNIEESRMTQLLKLARAAVTGQAPRLGEHKEVHLG